MTVEHTIYFWDQQLQFPALSKSHHQAVQVNNGVMFNMTV